MRNFLFSLALWACWPVCVVSAQEASEVATLLPLAGVRDAEDLDEGEMERLTYWLRHPLAVNLLPRARLLESGLLTPYQVASLLDYRQSHGDILSFTELAAVDGFGEENVRMLRPCLSLASARLPGQRPDSLRTGQETLLRCAGGPSGLRYGLKNTLTRGDRWSAFIGVKTPAEKPFFPPSLTTVHLLHRTSGRHPGKWILGDFGARFGQGLALWSGFSLAGFSDPASFVRRPSGLYPCRSFSPAGMHRGLAGDVQFGRFILSGFVSLPGLWEGNAVGRVLPGANLAWYGRSGQVSATVFGGNVVSLEGRLCLRGADFFAEVAADGRSRGPAAVAGTVFPVGKSHRVSVIGRFCPPQFGTSWGQPVRTWSRKQGECGVAFGWKWKDFSVTADYAGKGADSASRQWKFYGRYPLQLSDKSMLTIKITERLRPGELLFWKTGLRVDWDGAPPGWTYRLRAEGMLCRSAAFLAYADVGRKAERWALYGRGTLFRIDHWDDRIYSYERDAPENFTVPAYYGRGYAVSLFARRRLRLSEEWRRTLRLYARVSYTACPWGAVRRPARFEAKLQAVYVLR